MRADLKTVCLTVLLSQLRVGFASRVNPERRDDDDCGVSEKKRSCSLTSVNGTWTGTRTYEYPKKFILLWPMPFGNYEHARRVCEACDLEVAEVWDEDDHGQIMDLIKTKYNLDAGVAKYANATFWLGGVSPRNETHSNYDWTYQDGITLVRFHHLRFPDSWTKEGTSSSGIPDKSRDCISIGPDSKDPSKIVWSVESCDQAANYAVCQFKRKRHCYDETNTTPLMRINYTIKAEGEEEETIVKPQSYHISNYPLSWELAKETCEQEGKTLLIFQTSEEHRHFRKIFLSYLADKPQYFHTDFWIGAKFYGSEQYEKLGWRVRNELIEIANWKESGSGGINKTWGPDPYAPGAVEPNDASGNNGENCVYVKFYHGKEATHWYATDCDRTPKFFVCRDDNMDLEQKSMVEYCQTGKYIKREMQDCKANLILRKQKPECVCSKGVHGLTEHHNCNSRLLVGDRCIKLHSKGVLHWKILDHESVSESSWLIAQSRNRKAGRFIEWFNMKINSSRQIFGNSNIYYSGVSAALIGTSRYCFAPSSGSPNEFFEIKIRIETAKITFLDSCPPGTEVNAKKHKIGTTAMNECELTSCKRPPMDNNEESPFAKECGQESGSDDEKCQYEATVKEAEALSSTIRPEVTVAPETGSKNLDVNEQMLIHAIDTSFKNDEKDLDAMKPQSSWNILERLFNIAESVCSCMVPKSYFNLILDMFKVAHFGQAYEYSTFFTKVEEQQILKMLSECKTNADNGDKSILCERNSCNDRVRKLNIFRSSSEMTDKLVDDTGYQGVMHHHVMEAVWSVIDVWNVACIKEFRSSYLLYHHLEQGMEALFTEELRKLWHFPNVDESYYRRLLGPMESTYLMNLHHCVTGMYLTFPKVHRLSRPKTSTVALLGKRIRSRRIKEYAEKTGYENPEEEVLKFEDNSTDTSMDNSLPVFCSRDQYCMKW